MSFLSNKPRLTQNGGLVPAYDSQSEQIFAEPPVAIESCIHDLIEQHCQEQPEAPAVCAWDGEFTYRQLSNLAHSLGTSLSARGVGTEDFVPIYFEKSRWAIIAVLGVLYAGGAFAPLVVASSQNASQAGQLAPDVVVVHKETGQGNQGMAPGAASRSKPSHAAYAMFTSGSTGAPTGAVIEHRSISSSIVDHGNRLNLTRTSRALHFASYAFDVCLTETLAVLVHGGCVCIPSEVERRGDLATVIRRLRVNWALLMPSMARSLDPKTLPTLETLVCAGEALTAQDRDYWAPHLNLFNAYGPTECSIFACVHAVPEAADLPIRVGLPVGGSCWIVDERNVQRLCEVGKVGELLIEGPIVGRGYIGCGANTAAGFVDRPDWLRKIWPSVQGKVYRTGELARCHVDGSIERLGCRDSQLKIAGHQMEAAEIEYHVRSHPSVIDAAVEVIQPRDALESSLLVAFVVRQTRTLGASQATTSESELVVPDGDFQTLVQQVKSKLRHVLPGYMVPTVFLEISSMPLSTNGQLDRRSLRQLGNYKTQRDLLKLGLETTAKTPPRNPKETLMQRLLGEVLQMSTERIGIEDNFWNLGGDSLQFMKLAGLARKCGMILEDEDAWGDGTLEEMALSASMDHLPSEEVPAFSLCKSESEKMAVAHTLGKFQVKQDEIEDIYPCTPLQEGLFAVALKHSGAYTMCMEFELPINIDINKFRRAWQATVEANPILRTRIVPGKEAELWQAVIRDVIPWDTRNPSEDVPKMWKDWKTAQRLFRLALSDPTTPNTPRHFTLLMHHALFDAWGIPLLLQQVEAAYRGESLPSRPFSPFIRYLKSQSQSEIDRYWTESLSDLNAIPFPKLPSPDHVAKPTKTIAYVIPIAAAWHTEQQITLPTMLLLAWGLLVSHHTESWDVVFGLTVAGRGAPVEGIESMIGPTFAIIPMRLLLDPQATVIETLKNVQAHSRRTMSVEQVGLKRLSLLGAESAAATQFQSQLVIQADEGEHRHPAMFSKLRDLTELTETTSSGITIVAKPSSTSVALEIAYDPLMVTDVHMKRLIHQLEHIYQQIQQTPNARLEDIESIGTCDMAELRKWNGQPPALVEQCAHELIYQRTLAQPKAPAVCAWDGEFSYQELESHAEKLARRLVSIGVGPETFVPLYFEKSRWTTVAILAVLKAGGAFALLDPSNPMDRLQKLCHEMRASILLCSEANARSASQLGPLQAVILGSHYNELVTAEGPLNTSPATPSNAMYLVFTSGSTGKPKGAVITHGGWCTMAQAICPKSCLSPESRVLQFSAYACDASIFDNLATLVAGGCICVPSQQDCLSNLTGAIADFKANWALMTPTVARTLNAQTSPTLKHLLLGGEPVTPADAEQWSPYLHLMNCYGPTECAILMAVQQAVDPKQSTNIGLATGAVGWVVKPSNVNQLCPIGAVGELIVEGPTVAREYLNQPKKTAEAFPDSVPWLRTFRASPCRLYRTGDLVHYNDEGEFIFIGRKDTQVKLRGQRMEMGEVEYHLHRCFPGAQGVVADILPSQDGRPDLLAGFVVRTPSIGSNSSLIVESDASFSKAAAIALAGMKQHLPSYMVPAVLIPLSRLPVSATGKLDRRVLQAHAALLTSEQLDEFRMSEKAPIRGPETHTQAVLRQLYGVVLSIPEDRIGIEDNFFRRGGDSLSAMKLVTLARKSGYSLTVGDIFTTPRITDLAATKNMANVTHSDDTVPPLTLISDLRVQEQIISALQTDAGVARVQIEDLYPCTPLQEGLMALTLKTPGKYVATFVYDLVENVDLDRFQAAWNATCVANPILRTRLIQGPGGSFQVVMREAPYWEKYSTQQDYQSRSVPVAMGLNVRLLCLSLIASPPRLVMTIHHALYDGWSLSLIWDQVEAAYRGQSLQPRPFSPFIRYLHQQQDESASASFWRFQFEDLKAAVFPALPHPTYEPVPNQAIHRRHSMRADVQLDFTIPTAIQLAWAIVMSYYTDSVDVVFGLTLNGRTAAVSGIDQFTGPTVTTVPFRVRLELDKSVQYEARQIQQQLAAMTAYQQTGLRKIGSFSSEAARACKFQSHVGINSLPESSHGALIAQVQSEHLDLGDFASYGFVLACNKVVEVDGYLDIVAQYDPSMLDVHQAQRMVSQFEHILDQVLFHPDMSLRSLSAVSDHDREKLARWNATLPSPLERCLHDSVLDHVMSRPSALAVCAWDGDLTFEELASSSLVLAQVLGNSGLQAGSVVPISLKRSKWSVISIMAVLRAGATAVCIDPNLPTERLQSILDQTQPGTVICSEETKAQFEGHSAAPILTVPFQMQVHGLGSASVEQPSVSPVSPAFIVFTSGSTGRPKGIVMEHRNLSTSIRYHSDALNITKSSRMLHFASYAFDASIYEIFTTLVTGGCVCIPSESERMNAIEQFIADKQVNAALLTPSMLAILDPDRVPSLETVISGGEALTRHVASRWAPHVTLINAYGPAETIICAAGPVVEGSWTPGTVGPVLGGAAWVTAPSDPTRLVPLGAIGELIIEGPIVTRGYLNSPELTQAGYIDPPEWLTRWRNGRPGRLYRSGDLVELTTEGTIRFIGRKDTQVKLRGQRIELAEVEFQVRSCTGGLDSIVDIATIDSSPTLFACIILQDTAGGKAEGAPFLPATSTFQKSMQVAELSLRDAIPRYMVPSIFLPIAKVPRTTGGKVDRRALRKSVEALLPSEIQRYMTAAQRSHRQPSTANEKAIHGIWVQALNKAPDMLGVDDSFFHLGGDSISAMQIVSQLKGIGIRTTVDHIFQQSTIAKLATTVTSSISSSSDPLQDGAHDTPFRLSAIQQLFLDRVPVHYNHFNQSFFFELRRPVQAAKVEQAVQWIVRTHSMLRARFSRNAEGTWYQTISKDIDNSYRYEQHENMSQRDAEALYTDRQQDLNIEYGPLIAVDLMRIHGGKQWLSLIVHHLVVDIVSWQTILDQLERLLESKPVSPPSAMSYVTWARLQEEHIVSTPEIRDQAAPAAMMDYWGLSETSNNYADVDQYQVTLNRQQTTQVLGPANKAFNTRPVELLQAALMHAFMKTFRDRPTPAIYNEGHGRDPWADDIDVIGTVGWFTNIWPSYVPLGPDCNLMEAVRRTKDGRRDVQDVGRFYLAARQGRMTAMEITLNYAGTSEAAESPNSLFKRVPLSISTLVNQGSHVGRFALIDILANVTEGRLSIDFLYNRHIKHTKEIVGWAERSREALSTLAQRFPTIPPRLTRSDVPLLRLTDEQFFEFEALTDRLSLAGKTVADAYPCAPIQLGMLISQAKNSKGYTARLAWTVKARDECPIDTGRLMRAWERVVERHPLLRTIFVDSPRGDGGIDQVVLDDVRPTMVSFDATQTESSVKGSSPWERSPLPALHPAHRLTVCRASTGSVSCALEIEHALLDGISRQIIYRDLQLAYDGILPQGPDHVYRDYISYIQKQPPDPVRTYWDKYTENLEACLFPKLAGYESEGMSTAGIGRVDRLLLGIPAMREFCRTNELTLASVFEVAWGLVLRAYARTDNVCYGYVAAGRDMPISGIEDAVGPFINTLIWRMDFRRNDASTLEMLRKTQSDFAQSLDFQYWPLAEVMRQHQGPLFNSIMSVQRVMSRLALPHSSLTLDEQNGDDSTEYDLMVRINIAQEEVGVIMDYRRELLTHDQAAFVLDAFEQAMKGIVEFSDQPVRSVPLLGGSSLQAIRRWNEQVPQAVERCVGDMILDNCRARPDSPAVCAWDGSFTYTDLEAQSAWLSRQLHDCYGVGPEVFVPIYAIKSRWVTVAITAVIRAGGAFILLDPSHPLARLRAICIKARATVILAPPQGQEIAAQLVSRVVTFGEEVGGAEGSRGDVYGGKEMDLKLTPDNALYGIFTSGSTGQPKGVIIQHRAFATSAVSQAGTLQIGPQSRVLQFASFAFDGSIGEMLTTLVQGGCICIPSEEQRQQALSRATYDLRANWASLTPSVARALTPAAFPTLRTLVVGGEAVSSKEVQTWSPMLRLILAYGPTECAVWCSGTVDTLHPGSEPRNLGRPFGCRMWIIDPGNPDLLSPIGAVGELVVEGPNIARGYLDDPSTTQAAFLNGLRPWLDGKPSRIYRTGDAARYRADGTLQYVARKDRQVKLRGQRFELAEVEHHLRQVFGQAKDIVAEVATTSDDTKLLVALIHLPDISTSADNHENSLIASATDPFRLSVQASKAQLHMRMPGYMVPSLYLPLQRVPLTTSGKLDRQQLHDAVGAMSLADLEAYSAPVAARIMPSTPEEQHLQQIWADVLGRPRSTIGVEDNFFRLGGDSLRAMSLISAARQGGLSITIANVFHSPRLRDLAQAMSSNPDEAVASLELAPFALVADLGDLISIAAKRCGVSSRQIEDIYPSTPLQEGLIALSTKKSTNRYKVTFRYQLDDQVDLGKFQRSWLAIAAVNPILRTRMIQSDRHPGTCQVVLRESPRFHTFDSQAAYDEHIQSTPMGLGDALVDLSFIWPCESAAVHFCLTMHHAVYDGWSLPSLWKQVETYYQSPKSTPSPPPFNQFIDYVQRQSNRAAKYWRNEFSGLSAPVWPPLPSPRHTPVADASFHHTITGLCGSGSEFTTTTFIHLAWALVMSYQTDSNDLVYGVTQNGRSAPVMGIEDMTGPTFTSFPLRIRLDLDCDTVETALLAIQGQAADRIPFQQFGLQNIRNISPEAARACQFQSHLTIQAPSPGKTASSSLFGELCAGSADYGAFAEYAFVVVCHLTDVDASSIQITVNYDPQVVQSTMVRRTIGQFSHLLQQLPKSLQAPLSQLDILSPDDKQELLIWNRELPSSFDVCLHDLVLAHASAAPNSAAICAWDGNLTYAELLAHSDQLATQLCLLGVHRGALVPLCLEKSKWAVITMLAVLRAGGTCVPLDPGHPPSHIQTIVRWTRAKLVLTSPRTRYLIHADCGAEVITLPLQGLAAHATAKTWTEPSYHDAAFVMFTSGSTGEPKGTIMEHVNLCTSIRDHSLPLGISSSSRAIHFASYSFDASIYEVFSVLANGGCVCIPSESDRVGNLAGFMREAHVNHATFTPSIINRLLQPEQVPELETIILAGEVVTQDIVDVWSPHCRLVTGYGPAEATVCAAAGTIDASSWAAGMIGPVTGGVGWVTVPSDVSRLAPIGAVGELVIEGPIVTRGYLHDTARTAAAYISPPHWLIGFRGKEKPGRLYRTGDLVQYTDNGWIRFVGRKDTQIKLRGQRIELSLVEHHVRQCFREAADIITDIVLREGIPTLIAFIAQIPSDSGEDADNPGDACNGCSLFLKTCTSFRAHVQAATAQLKSLLPVYMVPTIFLRLAYVPRTRSDKLDRQHLRDQASRLSNDQIQALSASSEGFLSSTLHPPRSARERVFQQLWATVLNISVDRIGTQDDFFELGGDSIQAMRIISLLRREGLTLDVSDIFAWPVLEAQAHGAQEYANLTEMEPYYPGSLLNIKPEDLGAFAVCELAPACPGLEVEDIEDILPTTEFQRHFLKQSEIRWLQLPLPMEIDSARLEKACHVLVDRHPLFRSVFLPYRGGYLQVLFRRLQFQLIQIRCDEELDAFVDRICLSNSSAGVSWGTPYFQALLITKAPSKSVLLIRCSHAQHDGEYQTLIIQDLISAYERGGLDEAPPPSFALYLRHRQKQANPQTYEFWKQYLQNSTMTALSLTGSDSNLSLEVNRTIPLPTPPRGITISSLVKAAWAVVLAQVTRQRDVVFGHVLNGRDTPIEGIHAISGPCTTISPLRISIRLPSENAALDLLHHVQDQYTRALPYAGVDFEAIREHSTSWPANASFYSVQAHQNGAAMRTRFKFHGHDCALGYRIIGGMPLLSVSTFPLQDQGQLKVSIIISSRLGSLEDIEDLLGRYCSAIGNLDRGVIPL
ncbi:nonribosomal peptide synthetase [Aspergillus luchuensis IFO 4308]|nr:nonribosomal peptide synthetase [Aspergillus luchuensis IFO 4308]